MDELEFKVKVTISVNVLNQSLSNPHPFIKFASFLLEVFINVFYIEIFNAFTLPINCLLNFNNVRTVRNILISFTHLQKMYMPTDPTAT